MPYAAYWEVRNTRSDVVRLFQGQRAHFTLLGMPKKTLDDKSYYLPEFAYFDAYTRYGHFFGARLESLDEINQRKPLIFRVTIGSLPSMASPFVGQYRLPRTGPLEEVS